MKRGAQFRRVLSILLLGLIFYGATVQAVHKHENLTAGDEPQSVSLTNVDPHENSSGATTGCSDCLICQLHQSFSATAVTHKQFGPPAAQTIRFVLSGFHDPASSVTTKETGRAPPLTS